MTEGIANKAPAPGGGKARVVIALIVAVVCVAAVAFWAGRVTLAPVQVAQPVADESVTVVVREHTLGRALNLSVQVTRDKTPVATNEMAGVVSKVHASGTFAPGDVAYVVGGVPVRVVVGPEPFYRPLSLDDSGADVRQLTNALVELGFLGKATDKFTSDTAAAVKAWQARLGMAQTGSVQLGELVAVPKLPTTLGVDRRLAWPGAKLTGGEAILSAAIGEPTFAMPVTRTQEALIPPDAAIEVKGQAGTWPAVVAELRPYPDSGDNQFVLLSPDGGPVCGNECGSIGGDATTWLTASVQLVPTTTGPVVPTSAITTDPAGQAWVLVVTDAAEQRREVTVLRSDGGLSVVEGVQVGERVRALAGGQESGPTTPTTDPATTTNPETTRGVGVHDRSGSVRDLEPVTCSRLRMCGSPTPRVAKSFSTG